MHQREFKEITLPGYIQIYTGVHSDVARESYSFDLFDVPLHIRYCSRATLQTHATFCDLRARIEYNEFVLSMRTSLDFRILYVKTNVAKESSAMGCKYID